MHLLVLLQLRERNFVERIRHKWWDERSKCPKPKQSKTGNTKRLDLNNMAGVFLVLVGGVIISLVLVVFEIRCKKMVEYFTSGQVILPGSRKVKCLVCICINNDIMLTTISLLMRIGSFLSRKAIKLEARGGIAKTIFVPHGNVCGKIGFLFFLVLLCVS